MPHRWLPPAWRPVCLALQLSATSAARPLALVFCFSGTWRQDRRCAFQPVDPGVYEGCADAGGRVFLSVGSKTAAFGLGPPTFAGRLFSTALDAQWKVLFTVLAITSA